MKMEALSILQTLVILFVYPEDGDNRFFLVETFVHGFVTDDFTVYNCSCTSWPTLCALVRGKERVIHRQTLTPLEKQSRSMPAWPSFLSAVSKLSCTIISFIIQEAVKEHFLSCTHGHLQVYNVHFPKTLCTRIFMLRFENWNRIPRCENPVEDGFPYCQIVCRSYVLGSPCQLLYSVSVALVFLPHVSSYIFT
jgi:hypothetical protein